MRARRPRAMRERVDAERPDGTQTMDSRRWHRLSSTCHALPSADGLHRQMAGVHEHCHTNRSMPHFRGEWIAFWGLALAGLIWKGSPLADVFQLLLGQRDNASDSSIRSL